MTWQLLSVLCLFIRIGLNCRSVLQHTIQHDICRGLPLVFLRSIFPSITVSIAASPSILISVCPTHLLCLCLIVCIHQGSFFSRGPSIKYVTLEGVREGVTVCDRGEGVKRM